MAKGQKSTALSALDITPEQIMAEETAELRASMAAVQKIQNHPLRRYAEWRREDDNYCDEMGKAAYVIRSICVIAAWYHLYTADYFGLFQAMFVHLMFSGISLLSYGDDGDDKRRRIIYKLKMNLFYLVLFPVLPLVFLLDAYIETMGIGRDFSPAIEDLEKQIAKSLAHEIVPRRYAQNLDRARDELLGPESEMRQSEFNLDAKLEQLKADVERYKSRLRDAGDDPERVDRLQSGLYRAESRVKTLQEAIDKHHANIVKTKALLDECETYVTKQLPGRLGDEELIAECEAREIGEKQAIENARQAQEHHVQILRDRLMQLAAVVSVPAKELPSTNPDGEMRTTFKRLDEMATKLAELEAAKIGT